MRENKMKTSGLFIYLQLISATAIVQLILPWVILCVTVIPGKNFSPYLTKIDTLNTIITFIRHKCGCDLCHVFYAKQSDTYILVDFI